MKKRNLYRLEMVDTKGADYECIAVFRTDNNYGLQGYVYDDGTVSKRYTPYTIPKYIIEECNKILKDL